MSLNLSSKVKYGFYEDRLIVVVAYLVALTSASLVILSLGSYELWIKIGAAAIVSTAVIFCFSVIFRNSSLYDPFWSVMPIVIVGYLIWIKGFPIQNLRLILLTLVVIYWGVRLTINWLKTWPGLMHEDWRYVKLATDTGRFYWLVSLLGIHLFPTLLVLLACWAFLPIVESNVLLRWTDLLGLVIAVTGVEFERRADNQLRQFKKNQVKGQVCNHGLWSYSRHPNYFGEILFWFGIFIIALGLNPSDNWIYCIGALNMIMLFVCISIPMMEKHQMQKPNYLNYQKNVSMLIPWFIKSQDSK